MYSWGCGQYGELGIGRTHIYSWRPQKVQFPESTWSNDSIQSISCGNDYVLLSTKKNKLWTWGRKINAGDESNEDQCNSLPREYYFWNSKPIHSIVFSHFIGFFCGDKYMVVISGKPSILPELLESNQVDLERVIYQQSIL